MRFLVFLWITVSLGFVACAGDTSALMSTWNDGSVGSTPLGGGGGGQGGQVSPSNGGTGPGTTVSQGGAIGQNSGSINVPGGTRDLATAQCTSTTGGTCPVSRDYIECITGKCATPVTTCYQSDGISSAIGGDCRSYANCMLGCPCNAGRGKCEDDCSQNYAASNPDCSNCLVSLYTCASRVNCPTMIACSQSGS